MKRKRKLEIGADVSARMPPPSWSSLGVGGRFKEKMLAGRQSTNIEDRRGDSRAPSDSAGYPSQIFNRKPNIEKPVPRAGVEQWDFMKSSDDSHARWRATLPASHVSMEDAARAFSTKRKRAVKYKEPK